MSNLHGEDAALPIDLSFVLGRTCWHVMGTWGTTLERRPMCGWRGEWPCGDDAYGVVKSQVSVCKTCDSALDGAATSMVYLATVNLCPSCDPTGQVWDPRVNGNVVTCDHHRVLSGSDVFHSEDGAR